MSLHLSFFTCWVSHAVRETSGFPVLAGEVHKWLWRPAQLINEETAHSRGQLHFDPASTLPYSEVESWPWRSCWVTVWNLPVLLRSLRSWGRDVISSRGTLLSKWKCSIGSCVWSTTRAVPYREAASSKRATSAPCPTHNLQKNTELTDDLRQAQLNSGLAHENFWTALLGFLRHGDWSPCSSEEW